MALGIDRSQITEDTPLRLGTAAEIYFPDDPPSVKVLRAAGKNGHLRMFRLANKDYTTLKAMKEYHAWLEQPKRRMNAQNPAIAPRSSNPLSEMLRARKEVLKQTPKQALKQKK